MKLPIQNVVPTKVIESTIPGQHSAEDVLANMRADIMRSIEQAIAPLFANVQRGNAAVSTATPPKGRTDTFRLPPADDNDRAAQLVNKAQSHGYKLPKAED